MTSFGPPKLFKIPSSKKLTQLSNTLFSQPTFLETINTLSHETSHSELNVSSVTPINNPSDRLSKFYSTIRVHTTQST